MSIAILSDGWPVGSFSTALPEGWGACALLVLTIAQQLLGWTAQGLLGWCAFALSYPSRRYKVQNIWDSIDTHE